MMELAVYIDNEDLFCSCARRGSSILNRLAGLSSDRWQKAVIDIPKRRHQQIRYVDERVCVPDYDGALRQVAVQGLGRENPTLFLSNNFEVVDKNVAPGDGSPPTM